MLRPATVAGVAFGAALVLAACGTDNNTTAATGGSSGATAVACATGTLTAQGSTAQKNAMDQWIKNYQTNCAGAQVNYQGTGSGAGQQAFISGTAGFAGSDSALTPADQPKADARCPGGHAVHLPMVVGPIAVAYKLPGVSGLRLRPATLAGIFGGAITRWNDAAIAADNPGAPLPGTAILAVHRSDSSGTTDNFTTYLAAAAGTAWTFGHDKVWRAPGGQAEKGSDGVSAAIAGTAGAIGYVEWSFAQVNNLDVAKIRNGAGEYATLRGDSAGRTIAGAAPAGTGDDLRLAIDYTTTAAGAYPIVLVSYEIVCDRGNTAGTLPLLRSFLIYTSSAAGQSAVASLGYAPLPDTVRSKVAAVVAGLG